MFTLLCITGALWVAGSALFVLALAVAGRKPMPAEQTDGLVLQHAA